MFLLSCLVLCRFPISTEQATVRYHSILPVRNPDAPRSASLCFLNVTHVLPSTVCRIPNLFCHLRTFGKKHSGVVSISRTKRLTIPVTPIESKCFTKNHSNLFRILLFRKHPGGGGPHIFRIKKDLVVSHLLASLNSRLLIYHRRSSLTSGPPSFFSFFPPYLMS